jgi:hypothetical protein
MANKIIKTAGIRGASGLVGTAITKALEKDGWSVKRISREFSVQDIKGLGLIINLAGHTINCRWTNKQKREIRKSRIETTANLSNAILECGEQTPALFISASAVGIYPSSSTVTPESAFDELSTERGSGFLSSICEDWEREAMKASVCTRVAVIRLGVVVSTRGGAFPKLSLPFKFATAIRFGSGKQPFSWISEEDVVGAIMYIINDQSISGPVNLVAPQIIDMNGVESTLSDHYKTKLKVILPEFVLKIVMGGSYRLVTEGQNVKPSVLMSKMYDFKYKTLGDKLREE